MCELGHKAPRAPQLERDTAEVLLFSRPAELPVAWS